MEVVSIQQCVEMFLKFAHEGFREDKVQKFLTTTVLDRVSIEPYLHWCPGFYTRNLVHKDSDFELLLLCWDKGQVAPVHGHEGEKCWARVECGKLRFINYFETAERQGNRVQLRQTMGPIDAEKGYLDGPAEIHQVVNAPEFNGTAISLHLYSNPFDECEIFDLETNIVSKVRLKYDSIGGKLCDKTLASKVSKVLGCP